MIPATGSGSSRPGIGAKRPWFLSQMGFLFSQRFFFQIDSVNTVDQPIQDGIGQGRVGDDFVPVINWFSSFVLRPLSFSFAF